MSSTSDTEINVLATRSASNCNMILEFQHYVDANAIRRHVVSRTTIYVHKHCCFLDQIYFDSTLAAIYIVQYHITASSSFSPHLVRCLYHNAASFRRFLQVSPEM